jgi:hypothetical protein
MFGQVSTGISIINIGHPGSINLSLTNFTTSAASNIAAGSAVEISGAYFLADADVVPNASSWTAIATSTTAYLALTPSGTAGSQILSASWLSTAPIWDTTKQGWYTTAPSTIRAVASAYKVGATSYSNKIILSPYLNNATNPITSNWAIVQKNDLGSGWATALSSVLPPFSGRQVFTTSGSFIVPAGVTTVYLTGTGGGSAGSAGSGGAGGNAGEYEFRKSYSVTSETIIITIGTAGGNVTASSSNVSFSLIGGGGKGPINYGGINGPGGGAGGAQGSGITSGSGGAGAPGIFATVSNLATNGASGSVAGGIAGYGGGGGGGYNNAGVGGAGGAGKAGGGGGGGSGGSGGNGAGGAGSTGIIIIEY